MPVRLSAATPIPFLSRELADTTESALGLHGLPPWLVVFVRDAMHETGTLRENGAEQAAVARTALLQKLIGAARAWLDVELDLHEAAQETGRCEETIRRAVRAGTIPDRRASRRGRHRIRRGDLLSVATPERPPYDPTADAQSIAQLRRRL
jgi:hypothetical protein